MSSSYIDMDIMDTDPRVTKTTAEIGGQTFYLPLTEANKDEIALMYGISDRLVLAIKGHARTDMDFMRLVRDHKTRDPKEPPKAINSEDGASKEKQAEELRRRRVIEEAHRHDEIEDADDALGDYQRRSRVYVAASAVSLIVLFIGLLTLTLVAWPLGLAITAPGAIASAFSVTATAQRFNNNQVANKKAALKSAKRKLRDYQT